MDFFRRIPITLTSPPFFSILLVFFWLLPSNALAVVYTADVIPWSGYWWPFHKGGLVTGSDYRGHPAPLEKYDLLQTGSYPGSATSWFDDKYYDPQAPTWWGECGDWAQAACSEHIEFFPSSEDNLFFRVGDKKGLITQARNNDIAIRADGTMPENFHYWLLYYIRDQKKAFVADLDAGEEVWSYPIFKYDMRESRVGGTDSVTVTIYYANDLVPPDTMGTVVRTATYTYDLTLDAQGEILDGEWMGNSMDEHPDGLTFSLAQRTSNPYLNYSEVLRLARSRDDFIEDGQKRVGINPGTYNLILMDEDRYRISCSDGDTVLLDVIKQPGSEEDIWAVLKDADGNIVDEWVVSETSPMAITLTARNPPYLLELTQEDYADPNLYTVTYDLKKVFMQEIPYLPKNGMWSGFALTNPEDSQTDGIMLVTYDAQGDPIQTVSGPLGLQAGEKSLFFFSNLPWRRHEYADTERLVLLSDRPVSLLNLFGYGDNRMGCFVQGEKRGRRLVIPDVKASMSTDGTMTGAVINESADAIRIRMNIYTRDGGLFGDVDAILDKGERFPVTAGTYPFYSMPQGGWIDIEAVEDADLSGYQSLISSRRLESMFALPVNAGEKMVPHVPPPLVWITRVTLINPNDVENQIAFHPARAGETRNQDLEITLGPREKAEVEIGDWFGRDRGDPLFQSVIQLQGEWPFVGYYTYAARIGLGDEASLPLLEEADLRDVLVLPHFPGVAHWWNGVGIFNPSVGRETVRVEPYNYNGELLWDLVKYLYLAPGAYEVMFVQSIGHERAAEISFVKFVAEGPGGKIGGFYLYGERPSGASSGTRLFSGANM